MTNTTQAAATPTSMHTNIIHTMTKPTQAAATPTSMHTNIIPTMTNTTQAAATLKELRFPSPGLRAKHATLGKHPH